MNYNNALKIFNVSPPLLPEDIRKTYKSLVFKNHPDKYPSASDLEIEKQSKIMADINLAYELILKHIDHGINGEIPSDSFDIFNFDFGGVSISGFKEGPRIRKHPDHKSGAYQNLWHYIHKIQKDRHGLALRCWEKAIFKLLHDLPKHPDIDGILHNYIRDCSSLLMRLDMFTKAFELIKVLVNSGACSYYDFDPPAWIVWRSILKSLKHKNSIACWEKQFIDKVVFDDIRVSWACLYPIIFLMNI
ncbi:MAG: J domain-containing protein [Lentisphaerota bacterium]